MTEHLVHSLDQKFDELLAKICPWVHMYKHWWKISLVHCRLYDNF